jgi:hypothetical protein
VKGFAGEFFVELPLGAMEGFPGLYIRGKERAGAGWATIHTTARPATRRLILGQHNASRRASYERCQMRRILAIPSRRGLGGEAVYTVSIVAARAIARNVQPVGRDGRSKSWVRWLEVCAGVQKPGSRRAHCYRTSSSLPLSITGTYTTL